MRVVFGVQPGAARDVVLLNAGASLFIAGRAASIREGIAQAAEGIDSGRAAEVLTSLAAASHADGGAAA